MPGKGNQNREQRRTGRGARVHVKTSASSLTSVSCKSPAPRKCSRAVAASPSAPWSSSVTIMGRSATAWARRAKCRKPCVRRRNGRAHHAAHPDGRHDHPAPGDRRFQRGACCCARLAGTGVIAGGGVRAVLEAAGIRDILTKSQGSANMLNVVAATFKALEYAEEPREEAKRRGQPVEAVMPYWLRGGKMTSSLKKLRVTYSTSSIGVKQDQKDTVQRLGLRVWGKRWNSPIRRRCVG